MNPSPLATKIFTVQALEFFSQQMESPSQAITPSFINFC